jgi:lipopolysaccharide transport system permease protein
MNAFRARIGPGSLEPRGDCGLALSAELRNAGSRNWPAGGPVFFAYQVLDRAAQSLLREGERVAFDRDVPPGGRVRVSINIELPEDDGTYTVFVSPVEEGVAWFYERGSEFLEVDVEVSTGKVVVLRQRKWSAGARALHRALRRIRNLLVSPFTTIWPHRALIASMVRRDIRGRYRGSMAGMFWTVIHPLLLMLTYFFVFSVVLKVRLGPGPESEYPVDFLLYFICGMLPWLAFSEALGRAASVLLEHRTLVTRVLFPVPILPVNIALSGLASSFFALTVFIPLLLYFRHQVPLTALYLPALLVPQLLLTIGLCWLLAALGVFLRDTGQFMAFILTLWFFATPICYPESALPASTLWLFAKNPMYVMARSYRMIFVEGSAPPWRPLAWMATYSLLAFFAGFAWFRKSQKSFADIL